MDQVIINSIQEMAPYIKPLKKIKIWVCNTACGKSYLTSLDDRFYDLDAYRSQLKDLGVENFEDETIVKMWELIKKGKIILNAAHGYFLKYLEEHNVPFVYMNGKPEVEAEYIERMKHRGSSEDFIKRFGWLIASHYENRANDKRGNFKIEMNPNEFVSDYIWQVFSMPKKFIQCHKFKSDKYKMAFIDLDGTLLDRESKLTDYTKKVMRQIKNKLNIVLTSGRGVDTISPILKELELNKKENFVICYNGAIVMKGNGEILEEHYIPKSNLELFLKEIGEENLSNCYLRTLDKKFCINDIKNMQDFINENKVYKIMIINQPDKIDEITLQLDDNIINNFNVFSSAKGLLEFVFKNVTKAKAGLEVSKLCKLSHKNLIAIGDGENDIDLFKLAGCSVAVCNSSEKVKKHAKFITDSNNDDGVAKALLKICMDT